ncbi:MAG: response regulator [Thermodesulfobacteriota bacterium]
MKDLIKWLKGMEEAAGNFYADAAKTFKDNKELSKFLSCMSAEEMCHKELVEKAEAYVEEIPDVSHFTVTAIEKMHKDSIASKLAVCDLRLKAGVLSEKELIDCVITVESSEMNDFLIYAVNSIKNRIKDAEGAVHELQMHKRRLKTFLEEMAYGKDMLEKFKHMPSFWHESVLIVDDSEPIIELLSAILHGESSIDRAYNGKEALDMINKNYYSVIILDVAMPVMDGIECYTEAIKTHPKIKNRVLFFTAYDEVENIKFFKKNGLKFILKPAHISEIKKSVTAIIEKNADTA